MRSLNLEQGSQEWHSFRRQHIQATDVRKLMGICPFKGTPLKVWESKCLGKEEPFFSPAAQRGSDLEPSARAWLELQTGIEFKPACIESSLTPWAAASLDGINEEHRVIAEIKCGGQRLHDLALNGEIPSYYACQIQWQLYCSGYDKALYVSFMGLDGVIVQVDRDEELIESMVKTCSKFWFDNVLAFDPPNPTDDDWIAENSPEWLEYADMKKQTAERLRQAKFEDDAVKAKIEAMAGNRVRVRGGGISYSQSLFKGAVDYKAFLSSKGIDEKELESFRKSPTVRTTIKVC